MNCPKWLYQRIDKRGKIPAWVRIIWPDAHWCCEMDSLLIIDNWQDCFCGICDNFPPQSERDDLDDLMEAFNNAARKE